MLCTGVCETAYGGLLEEAAWLVRGERPAEVDRGYLELV